MTSLQRIFSYIVGGIIAAAMIPLAADALVQYTPAALLQPNDITSTMVRDNTLTDVDVNQAANISIFKIGSTTPGVVPFMSGSGLNASTSALYFDRNALSLIIASSSPSLTATSTGSLYVAGTVFAQNLTASSTLTLGTTTYALPYQDGSANQALTTNGSKILSWATSGTTITTDMPHPDSYAVGFTTLNLNNNTLEHCGLYTIPAKIVVNKISANVNTLTTSGTVDITMYPVSGASQTFSVTSPNITSNGVVSTTVSAVSVDAGKYYICMNPNGTFSATWDSFNLNGTAVDALNSIAGEPEGDGYLTITASTPASSFNPTTGFTAQVNSAIIWRLDN